MKTMEKTHWNAALSILQLLRLACICVSEQESIGKDLLKGFSLWRGVDSSFMSQKGTAAETGSYCMLRNFLFASNHCFFVFFSASKVSTSTGGEGWASLAGHPCLPHPPSLLLCPISCWSTSSLRSPPTTRWKKVFYSGNSVCRTRCWLSGVLWLFQQLLGASGPTVKVF